jgi:hypothetical protein
MLSIHSLYKAGRWMACELTNVVSLVDYWAVILLFILVCCLGCFIRYSLLAGSLTVLLPLPYALKFKTLLLMLPTPEGGGFFRLRMD